MMISVGCGFQKFAADKIVVAALKNKQSDIVEAAKFSIGATYDNTIRYFPASGVNDSAMRKKIESLGSDVYVKYQKENDPIALPDSTVVFTSFHDVGTLEVIFDFATYERNLTTLISKERNTQLTKVGERTYYRRSPEPR
jgi:hypothetical protein